MSQAPKMVREECKQLWGTSASRSGDRLGSLSDDDPYPVMLNRTDQRLLRDAILSVRRDGTGFIPSPYWAARSNFLVADGLLERRRNEPWPLDHWAAFTYRPTRRGVRAYNAAIRQERPG